ncbi:tetratricopeptide repeat protein [Pseudoxanthomonas suwonensis]|uniref:tetratricopeptide repeat protein n=1 Tax=Pseudoxanthomonas suwonensis TaxID=314722 RepID=UPI001185BF2E|nr:sel1 repeat family protein [Pseudoxanthomonas suwonensis]
MNRNNFYSDARRSLRERDGRALIEAAEILIKSIDESEHGAGFLMRGGVYEYGATGVAQDLSKAISDYRRASVLTPAMISYWYLGRALMKSGEIVQAERFLKEAAVMDGALPDVELDLGRLYERSELKDLQLSLRYFRRAAIRGRVQGFWGMARVLRHEGRNFSYSTMVLCTLLAIPVLWVLLGKKAFANY